jgi:hypothetical protein
MLPMKSKNLLDARSANETSTAMTPAEVSLDAPVIGVGILDNADSLTAGGRLKDAKTYFELLKKHIEFDGGGGWDVLIVANRREVVIRQDALGSMLTVRFPYTAANVKFHWVAFELHSSVLDYFNWVSEGNVVLTGDEDATTPPSQIG